MKKLTTHDVQRLRMTLPIFAWICTSMEKVLHPYLKDRQGAQSFEKNLMQDFERSRRSSRS